MYLLSSVTFLHKPRFADTLIYFTPSVHSPFSSFLILCHFPCRRHSASNLILCEHTHSKARARNGSVQAPYPPACHATTYHASPCIASRLFFFSFFKFQTSRAPTRVSHFSTTTHFSSFHIALSLSLYTCLLHSAPFAIFPKGQQSTTYILPTFYCPKITRLLTHQSFTRVYSRHFRTIIYHQPVSSLATFPVFINTSKFCTVCHTLHMSSILPHVYTLCTCILVTQPTCPPCPPCPPCRP